MTGKDIAVLDHSARAHSNIVGGSTAKRVLNCTASVLHNQKYPNTESEFAAEGTACHEAVDFILQGKVDQDEHVIGLKFHKIEITKKLFNEAIKPAIEYFDMLNEEMGGIDFYNEQRVKIPDIEDAFGTCDIIGYAPKVNKTIVLDWKFGVGVPVSAVENAQMMYYGLGAMHTAPTNQFFAKDRPVELFIAQPRSKEGEPYSRWVTSTLQLEAFGADLRNAVNVALSPEAEFHMGDWCKFCPGEMTCPLKRGMMQNAMRLSPQEVAEQLADLLPQADSMIAFGKAIKDAAHKAMELGATFPTHKIVDKYSDREWVDEKLVEKVLAKAGLPVKDQFAPAKRLSPAQVEAVLKDLKIKELPTAPDGSLLTRRFRTGTTMAPIDDKRPQAVVMKAGLQKLAERLASK